MHREVEPRKEEREPAAEEEEDHDEKRKKVNQLHMYATY